jgi:hypothetical protein
MIEKIISLICEEFGYEEDAINENTQINELIEEGTELEDVVRAIEGEFYVDLSEEISGDMTVAQVAEMLE